MWVQKCVGAYKMKITKSQLKQIIKEEIFSMNEYGSVSNFGGMATSLASVREPVNHMQDGPDSIVQSKATGFFMDLGLNAEITAVMVNNIAIPDLISVMEKIPKIWTADEEPLEEVSSEKQRRWACAQKDKPASDRADSLSAKEAEEMCTSKIEEDD